jgi:hypothetical protein
MNPPERPDLPDDATIAREIQARGLEAEYLRELAASLGHEASGGWSQALLRAIEQATLEERRKAALRTLELGE